MHTQPDIHMPIGNRTKIYKAIITQTATNDPTVKEIINTVGKIIWTRDSIGAYLGTLTGAFTSDKITITPFSATGDTYLPIAFNTINDYSYQFKIRDQDTIELYVCLSADFSPTELSYLATALVINLTID